MCDERDRGESRPEWWTRNDEYKRWLDLPTYEPPRFSDGRYVHEVVAELEDEFGCSIQFVSTDPEYGTDWQVRIDRVVRFPIGRYRNEDGNTVYEMSSDRFVGKVTAVIREE